MPKKKELLKEEIQDIELQKAEQQILGFYTCYQGYDIEELITSMNLTRKEFDSMIIQGMLEYLPKELVNDILKVVK